jgi:hypothetical protein
MPGGIMQASPKTRPRAQPQYGSLLANATTDLEVEIGRDSHVCTVEP